MAPRPGRTRAAGPNGAMLRPHSRALQNHTQLLQLQRPGKGQRENKNRKDGRITKTKTQRGTILWKIMKWDRRQVYDADTAQVGNWC